MHRLWNGSLGLPPKPPSSSDLIARTSANGRITPSYTRCAPTEPLKRVVGTGWRPLTASLASFVARPAILGPTVASALPARNDDAAELTAARLSSASASGAFSGVQCFFLNLGRSG